jgi:riboflavin kinase/FMN adenylyltransferase
VRVVHGFGGWPEGPLHVAVGVFDGVHRGHQEVVRRLRVFAHGQAALAVAASFDPLPIQVLAPGAPPSALSDADERAELLTAAGSDVVVFFRSEPSLFALSPAAFVDRLRDAGEVRRIVVGQDFRFGHGREGDVTMLAELGGARGIDVEVVPSVEVDGEVVSSTRIRNLLLAGDVRGAATLLGRSYGVRGRIVRGDQRGRALGYPTIDVATPRERLLPRDGIYATWLTVGSKRQMGATNLGVRPAPGGGERVLESFILDRSGDLDAERVGVTFVERLRDELRFESAEALVDQIRTDIKATRRALGS